MWSKPVDEPDRLPSNVSVSETQAREGEPEAGGGASEAALVESGATEPATAESTAGADAPLQFDKAEMDEAPQAVEVPMCSNCTRPVVESYYQVGPAVVCAPCKDIVVKALESGKGWDRFFGGLRYGMGAAILGAIVWYAIREITQLEIGLVAIGIGILVGIAVKRGAGGFGGRRYQFLAVALTYASITMANVPLIVKELQHQSDSTTAAAPTAGGSSLGPSSASEPTGTAGNAAPPPPAQQNAEPPASPGVFSFLFAWVMIFLFALALPFLAGAENIIGIIIIGIGLYEAWKITRHTPPQVRGPFAVVGATPSASRHD